MKTRQEVLELAHKHGILDEQHYGSRWFDRVQDFSADLMTHKWVPLTDKELLAAAGWQEPKVAPYLAKNARKELLTQLRSVESAIREKNQS